MFLFYNLAKKAFQKIMKIVFNELSSKMKINCHNALQNISTPMSSDSDNGSTEANT